VPDLSRG